MSSTALLSLNNLSVWYTANHPVLSDFSLDLGTNELPIIPYFQIFHWIWGQMKLSG